MKISSSVPPGTPPQPRAAASEPVVVRHLPINNVSASSSRLPCLDGLRACAITLVVLCHGREMINVTLPPIVDTLLLRYWGTLGVEIFFGLSGYLITHLLVREYSATGGISLRKFYLRRGFRILPPLFLFLAVVVGLNLAGVFQVPWPTIAMGALFVQNYNLRTAVTGGDARFVGHLWSLSAEEQFYLLWPFALAWLGPKRVRKVALVLALAAPGIRVCNYFLFPGMRGYLPMMFHTSYDCFLWGCLLALYQGDLDVESILKRFRSSAWFYLVWLFYMIGGPLLDIYGGGTYSLLFGLTLRAVCVAFIIAWLGRNLGFWLAKFLNTVPMRVIGILSYSLYLWQELFITKGQHMFFNSFIVGLSASLAAAGISYLLMEKPFLKLRRRLNAGRPTGQATQIEPRARVPIPEPISG